MEEITSLIFHGSKLARELESNMNFSLNFANQPYLLTKSCDEIITIFSFARDRLNSQGSGSGSTWNGQVHEAQVSEIGELGGRDMGGFMIPRGGGGTVQQLDMSDSGSGSSSQRLRRRKDDVERRTVRRPAPRMGNTEIPPDDGFAWRKYGQKEILGHKFPRSYYRCTHQKLYHCPAKKQVQRLDNDPFIFEITYRGDHTCHMSSTAPSFLRPPRPPLPLPPTSAPVSRWLSMDINPTGEATSTFATDPHVQMYGDFGLSGAGMSSGGGAALSTTTTTTSSRYGSNVEYQLPVADLADAMFYSGSSSTNSMDLIFSSMDD
ncbi:WRKY transcription factor 55 [Camellia lanceoleosa]|uniref:WRKY transcription factor 55 n=1 Tax=Camellia lanceoleosa TaxID=1840588 RepID=A0ACC0H4N4_9ERIC|nr:WRKY transcription factor 55 [Camellia lanceoleosa]